MKKYNIKPEPFQKDAMYIILFPLVLIDKIDDFNVSFLTKHKQYTLLDMHRCDEANLIITDIITDDFTFQRRDDTVQMQISFLKL